MDAWQTTNTGYLEYYVAEDGGEEGILILCFVTIINHCFGMI